MDRKDCTQWKTCEPSGFSCPDKCGNFEPMENKVTFEREEHVQVLLDTFGLGQYSKEAIKYLKSIGRIRKSPVEEAEEYEKYIAEIMDKGLSSSVKDLEWSMRIIRKLKAENENLKDELARK